MLDKVIGLPLQHECNHLYEDAAKHVHIGLLRLVHTRSLPRQWLLVSLEAEIETRKFGRGRRFCQPLP